MSDRTRRLAVVIALATYVLWTAATWCFEGRIETLLRPDATIDRLFYALGVNLLLGVAGSVALVRWLGRPSVALSPDRVGADREQCWAGFRDGLATTCQAPVNGPTHG